MTANLLFKYLFVVQNPKTQTFILLALILPPSADLDREFIENVSALLFISQALYIDVTAIISVLSGVPLPLVILQAIAQGAKLIIDAHRAQNSA